MQHYGSILREDLSGPAAQAVKRESTPVTWMGMAFGVGLSLAAATLAIEGTGVKGLIAGLRVTARWSFLLFWFAYTGRSMTTLFGAAIEPLARRGREFGLAYASAQLIHVGLLVWIFVITSHLPLAGKGLVFFTVALVWTYLLAFLSFGRLHEALGVWGWRALRVAALNYILFAFAVDFVPALFRPGPGAAHYPVLRLVAYVPFAAMSVAAPLLVVAAAAHRRLALKYGHAGLAPVIK